jgi:hypothetical protein
LRGSGGRIWRHEADCQHHEQDGSARGQQNEDEIDAGVASVVAFVVAWIGNQSGANIVAEDCEYTVKAWREEMAREAK